MTRRGHGSQNFVSGARQDAPPDRRFGEETPLIKWLAKQPEAARKPARPFVWGPLGVLVWAGALCAGAQAAEIILVTPDRRARAVDSVAANAAALDRGALDRLAAQHPAEALNLAPAVNLHRGSGAESLPAIRSPVLTGGQGAGSFLFLEDGVPIRAPGFANINQAFELPLDFAERVEVTRGPGSALYGSNAVHGLVNVLTPEAAPLLRASVEIGDFGRAHAGLTLGGRGLMGGLSALREAGWRDAAGLEQHKALLGWDGRLAGWTVRARLAGDVLHQETAGFVEGEDAYKDRTLARANANPEAFRDSQAVRAHAALTHPLAPDWTLTLTPFARWVDTDLLQHFFPSRALEETGQTGGGVLGALYWDPAGPVSVIVGADLDATSGRLKEIQSLPTLSSPAGYVQGVHYDYAVDAAALAAYAQARWRFAPRWTATLGARGERVEYKYDNRTDDGLFGRFRRPADRTDTFTLVTPKLALARTFEGGGSAWINLARGARPPQASDLYSLQTNQQAGDQEAETIDSAEIGVRGPLGPGRIEIAAYHMDKRNSAFRNAAGFTVADAKTRHQGVEIAGETPLFAGLSAEGWIAYGRHTYRFSDAAEGIVSGRPVDTAPRWLWRAALRWRATQALEGELSWRHTGAYRTDAAGERSYPGHDVLDARAEWRTSPTVAVFAAVRNLADADYAERADFAFGVDRYFPGDARALSVGVRARR